MKLNRGLFLCVSVLTALLLFSGCEKKTVIPVTDQTTTDTAADSAAAQNDEDFDIEEITAVFVDQAASSGDAAGATTGADVQFDAATTGADIQFDGATTGGDVQLDGVTTGSEEAVEIKVIEETSAAPATIPMAFFF